MNEQQQITYMQIRLIRIASERMNMSLHDVAQLFKKYDVLPFIRDGFGIFHVEGDDAVFEEVKEFLLSKGALS